MLPARMAPTKPVVDVVDATGRHQGGIKMPNVLQVVVACFRSTLVMT